MTGNNLKLYPPHLESFMGVVQHPSINAPCHPQGDDTQHTQTHFPTPLSCISHNVTFYRLIMSSSLALVFNKLLLRSNSRLTFYRLIVSRSLMSKYQHVSVTFYGLVLSKFAHAWWAATAHTKFYRFIVRLNSLQWASQRPLPSEIRTIRNLDFFMSRLLKN